MLRRIILLPGIAFALCFGAAGCALNFLESGGPGINVQNETNQDLTYNYKGLNGEHELGAGTHGAIGVKGCEHDTLVFYTGDREMYASLTDKRLCEDGTLVVVRGEDDIVIESR